MIPTHMIFGHPSGRAFAYHLQQIGRLIRMTDDNAKPPAVMVDLSEKRPISAHEWPQAFDMVDPQTQEVKHMEIKQDELRAMILEAAGLDGVHVPAIFHGDLVKPMTEAFPDGIVTEEPYGARLRIANHETTVARNGFVTPWKAVQ